jgi:hypothetical protein
MGHTLFTQLLAAQLPVEYWGTSVIDQLKHLENAGYIKVAFSSPRGAAPSRATVSEVTHLGRAVARYFGADAGFAGQSQTVHRGSSAAQRLNAGQARSRSAAC